LKKYKSPGSDEIPAELIQAGGEILLSAIHKLINSVWNKEKLPNQWKDSIIIPVHRKGDKTECITAINLKQNFIEYPPIEVRSVNTYMKLLGIISVAFDITDQLLIRFSAFAR
jgi:hypothetical protein